MPYSPLARVELCSDRTTLADFSSVPWDIFTAGYTKNGNQIRRVWPAFGRHGGAWERRIKYPNKYDLNGLSIPSWSVDEPSLTQPPHRINDGEFVRESEWHIYSSMIKKIASIIHGAITGGVNGGETDSDGAFPEGDSPDEISGDGGAYKAPGEFLGGAIKFNYAGTDYEYCISYLADRDPSGNQIIGLRLYGAIWRDRKFDPEYEDDLDSICEFILACCGPSRCERRLVAEYMRPLMLPSPELITKSQTFDPNNEQVIQSASLSMSTELKQAVDSLPLVFSSSQRIVSLPW